MKPPINQCLLNTFHDEHDWWYTSEGGGHMTNEFDIKAKGFKAHHCLGIKQIEPHSNYITIYGTLAKYNEKTAFGDSHYGVPVVSTKYIKQVGTWFHDNGYESREVGVYQDAQGRIYRMHVTVDMFNNVYFIRQDGVFFDKSLPYRARDLDLNPLTPATAPVSLVTTRTRIK